MRDFFSITTILALGLGACTQPEDAPVSQEESMLEEAGEEAEKESAPEGFAETAWRVTAENGARYATYFDVEGRYRDLRNGDLWQEGDWTYSDGPSGKQLCMTPNEENGVESCWQPGRVDDDTMFATGPGDRRIELTRVNYQAPEPTQGDEEE